MNVVTRDSKASLNSASKQKIIIDPSELNIKLRKVDVGDSFSAEKDPNYTDQVAEEPEIADY